MPRISHRLRTPVLDKRGYDAEVALSSPSHIEQRSCKTPELYRSVEEKINWCPVAPIVFRNEPFGENVEGLRRCWDKCYGSMSVFN